MNVFFVDLAFVLFVALMCRWFYCILLNFESMGIEENSDKKNNFPYNKVSDETKNSTKTCLLIIFTIGFLTVFLI